MKILVVDDHPPIRDLCYNILQHEGYEVMAVSVGDEALMHVDAHFDILLTDISMPGSVNGIQLAHRFRMNGYTDAILMTAYPELNTVIEGMREGAYDYLVKPFTADTLLLTIKRCLDKRRLSRELALERELRSQSEQAHRKILEMERVKETFGQFATPEVADYVLKHPDDFWKRGERRMLTILFSDVRKFTPYAESASPEEVVSALNTMFSCAIEAVQKEGGILNKFIGDGMLAIFGAPISYENHAERAVRAAIAIQRSIGALQNTQMKNLRVGVGVNTGEVVAGCMGTQKRFEYSVIGHAVNVAARLEEFAKPGQILLGEETAKRVSQLYTLKTWEPVLLPGVSKPVTVSELTY